MESSRIYALPALAAAALLAGCSGGGGGAADQGSATLSVSLMDAPVDNVTEVHVQIAAMWIKPESGPAEQLTLTSTPLTVDLMELTDENAAVLIDEAVIEPGTYEWLAMDVNATFDGIYDSYVMTDIGGQEELRVPSGRVRLVGGFEVEPNQAVELLFDWDLRTGLVRPPGQPGHFLKPAFRMLDISEYGVLQGTVAATVIAAGEPNDCGADDADLAVGNVVYIFAGADIDPDDVDGIAADPVATADVAQNTMGDYVYRTLLAPGAYTVAFTCQAGNDDPEVDETVTPAPLEFVADQNATLAGDTVTVDFPATP